MISSDLRNIYQEIILAHSRNHGPSLLNSADGESRQVNPICGDEITLQLHLGADQVISEVCWTGRGCAISQASASLLADLARGLPTFELSDRIKVFNTVLLSRGKLQLQEELFGDAAALASISPNVARVKCALLAWTAAKHAIAEMSALE
jgi:nitrogen fixation NifU-like protein